MSDEPRSAPGRRLIFVDTDAGCDDLIALAWLLCRGEARVAGISTVFGNSSLQNTTANVLTLLDALDADLPVTMGATAPLVYPRTGAGALVHGPDGVWGAQEAHDLDTVAQGAPGAIAAAARAHPGLTLLALGPLTNIALAVQAYPEDLAGVRLVALAGAAGLGSITPAAEFNAFADPHALQVVLDSPLAVELVTRDAFKTLLLDAGLGPRLARGCGAAGRMLARLIESYSRAVSRHGGPVAVPDAAAAIYALHPALGAAIPATVRVVTDGELTRGQTIVALSERHQAALALGNSGVEQLASCAADPAFDYAAALREASARAPRNASVVLRIDSEAMGRLLEDGLLDLDVVRAVGG
jgi:inosine-uridine nucleoside N-ribohydrolase